MFRYKIVSSLKTVFSVNDQITTWLVQKTFAPPHTPFSRPRAVLSLSSLPLWCSWWLSSSSFQSCPVQELCRVIAPQSMYSTTFLARVTLNSSTRDFRCSWCFSILGGIFYQLICSLVGFLLSEDVVWVSNASCHDADFPKCPLSVQSHNKRKPGRFDQTWDILPPAVKDQASHLHHWTFAFQLNTFYCIVLFYNLASESKVQMFMNGEAQSVSRKQYGEYTWTNI